ncbi:benzoyl-CoA reductase/2-hydroxyglutaryl-CoA dehydratase subunit BcrC/BadD/HgdB [Nocardioides albertanoniae]|uniref:Benzoyl-CoA reductase/2-hydroxyglutaryl-CoA dehydratase subunit BcrC/BadD/HgdB n=1 Tax=Nocardioides albertanoniae TaxID=1175486 RepID=A0A543A294_9ACTN|nr:2-hydroxyacyl-CoA dehydratase family protein [Nocardioides albertanoniae]TQL66670.1 benzoyl-CoA reductase/2-hydroxyglutaryl-CoA dehydratase subunit BcrC/BadD/HgdB [Nocardioides albertanoniae]
MTSPDAGTNAGIGTMPLIGIVGDDVPRQLVLAAGAVPRRLFGSWHEPVSAEAAELLGTVDAAAGRILDDLLSGWHDDLAGLLVCHDSQADLRIFYVLRILAQRGRLPFPVHLVDAPRLDSPAARRFVGKQYARLLEFCEQVTGRRADVGSLRRAAEQELALGSALETMRERRRNGGCTGAEALRAYCAAATMSPEEAVAEVSGAGAAVAPGATPVHVTGSNHPDAGLYDALERTGDLVVVGEDHDTGDTAWLGVAVDGTETGEVIDALAAAHLARPAAATGGLAAARAAYTATCAERTHARAAIALVREHDDAPTWDLAHQRLALDRLGVSIVTRTRIRPDEDIAALARESAAEVVAVLASPSVGPSVGPAGGTDS